MKSIGECAGISPNIRKSYDGVFKNKKAAFKGHLL